MAAQIVHDDDVAWSKRRYEELLDIGEEELAVDRPVEHAGGIDPVVAQRGEKGQRAPVAERDFRVQSLPAPGAAMCAGHVGLGPGLVDEDEARGIKLALVLAPLYPSPGDGRTILLAGEQAFF